jgi:hypothetical protein
MQYCMNWKGDTSKLKKLCINEFVMKGLNNKIHSNLHTGVYAQFGA